MKCSLWEVPTGQMLALCRKLFLPTVRLTLDISGFDTT